MMNYRTFCLGFGFSVWLLATLPFVFWGEVFFVTSNAFVLSAFFIGVVPVLYLLAIWVFSKLKLSGDKVLWASVLMAMPGMILDVACLKFHSIVFPNLTTEQSVVLGAWILWVHAVVLLIGIVKSRN
jgi:hypothetical protein